jgi:hypothetical protein
MWDAHLTRKSLMFAKSFRWLKAKFAICIGFYNFIRPHETLSRGEDRVLRPKYTSNGCQDNRSSMDNKNSIEVPSNCQQNKDTTE